MRQPFLNSLSACEDQIPIATPDLVCFHVSDDQIPIESPDLVCFYVSENQIPIATPDYASFSRPQWSDLDHIVELRVHLDLHGQLGKP